MRAGVRRCAVCRTCALRLMMILNMPELPEVETTRTALAQALCGKVLHHIEARTQQLRWPLTRRLLQCAPGKVLRAIHRRGKYLLFQFPHGTLIAHLGMSGHFRIFAEFLPPEAHDHLDLVFDDGLLLRYRDPRKFGSLHWTSADPHRHKLLRHIGPEPLGADFSGAYLKARALGRRQAIKSFIMDSHIVAGVGNIYAVESLFAARIHPKRAAGRISQKRYDTLAATIKATLAHAIATGGTTLKDYLNPQGASGYFSQSLAVYGRGGQACLVCATTLKQCAISNRATVYCPQCQN